MDNEWILRIYWISALLTLLSFGKVELPQSKTLLSTGSDLEKNNNANLPLNSITGQHLFSQTNWGASLRFLSSRPITRISASGLNGEYRWQTKVKATGFLEYAGRK